MPSGNDIALSVDTALLSATSMENEAARGASSLVPISGEPLIGYQIEQLMRAGITKFLVEVDTVAGALVALADRMEQQGVSMEFIRSPQELEGALGIGDLLFVMSDGIVADDALLAEMVENPESYIVTLDGRKENDCFERIDLNSFWGGLAMLDQRSLSSIAALPEEWSIGSSLLRQALQDAVVHRPLNQELLVGKQLRRISSQKDADALTKELLSRRAHDAAGMIEAQLLGPLATKFTPLFWNAPTAKIMLDGAIIAIAAGTAGLAVGGYAAVATALAFLCIFLIKLNDLLQSGDSKTVLGRLPKSLAWLLLVAAIFAASWLAAARGINGLFAPAIMTGLLLYAKKGLAASWHKGLLASPALLCLALLPFAIFGEWNLGLKLLILAQLALLLISQYFPGKAKQP